LPTFNAVDNRTFRGYLDVEDLRQDVLEDHQKRGREENRRGSYMSTNGTSCQNSHKHLDEMLMEFEMVLHS
jgi:hypothetical protein